MSLGRVLDMPTYTEPTPAGSRSPAPRRSLVPMILAGAVAALLLLAICLARANDVFLFLWIANGVAVATWLRTARGRDSDYVFAGMIAVGAACGELLGGASASLALPLALANTVEIVLAVVLARWLAPALSLSSAAGACRFVLAVAVLAPIPAALIASLGMMAVLDAPFLATMKAWWVGHALGMVVVAPLIMSLDRRAATMLGNPLKAAEAAALFVVAAGVFYFVCMRQTAPIGFTVMPLLILIAARLRLPGITVTMALLAIFALGSVMLGVGPSSVRVGMALADRVLLMQTMLLFGCVPVLLVASLLEERDRLSRRARAGQNRAELATAAKSRLLANVAHEIKSPVAGVIGIGELWSSGQLGPVTASQKEMADMLVRTARQVETLAHDLLDVARAESGAVKVELRPTDVCGVIEDVRRATALRPEAGALSLEVDFTEPHLIAVADSQRITQVIDNLATNAMKYGAAGGVIRFRAARVEDRIRIEVIDKGAGLSEAKQVELFEPFNRLGLERSTVEGHGIGLALSKRLVELQDGAIGVISAPGEGATFWIELPAA